MPISLRTPLALLVLLLACDSATKSEGQAAVSAEAKAEAKADTKIQLDAAAVAEGVTRAAAGADAAADAAAKAELAVAVPALRPVAEVKAELGGTLVLRAPDLDLEGVVGLVAGGQVKSAVELELLLNAPGGAAHHIDVDADGKLDYLQIVEVRGDAAAGAGVSFEIRAIPSSKLDASFAVLVATIATIRAEAEGAIKIVGTFAADVEGGAELEIERDLKASFAADAVVLADAEAGAFAAWALDLERTAHVSAHLSPVDIVIAADGAVHFSGDASASLDATRLAALRAALKLDLLAVAEPPQVAIEAGAKAKTKAKAGVDISHAAGAESSVKVGSGGGVKIGGGLGGSAGVSVGGSAGVSIGGSAGASVGTKGKAQAGIKIGR
ncbi:MAG TPA: hypothetical protein VIK91_18435 [Nannocystis sp.]